MDLDRVSPGRDGSLLQGKELYALKNPFQHVFLKIIMPSWFYIHRAGNIFVALASIVALILAFEGALYQKKYIQLTRTTTSKNWIGLCTSPLTLDSALPQSRLWLFKVCFTQENFCILMCSPF